jgi:hypothetical protein
MPAYTQAWINAQLDWEVRGQTLTPPATRYVGLFRVQPTVSSAGTELSAGGGDTGYGRQAFASNMTNWSGTQSDGSTSASSGTRNYISNNVTITFVASLLAAWNEMRGFGLFTAASGGTLHRYGLIVDASGNPITVSRNIDEAVVFEPGRLRLYLS